MLLPPRREPIFTTANIWYEHPEKIYSTNYHVGRILLGGSELEISYVKKNRIKFKVKGLDVQYMMTYFAKHSTTGFDTDFARIFSKENTFSKLMESLDPDRAKAVSKGKVVAGMNRETVLASYGYPSSHKTPDLDDDLWIYWMNHFKSQRVQFEDGKVVGE